MKAILASFFLLVFSFQVLPVKELGKVLFKGTMAEEIHEAEYGSTDDSSENCKLKKNNDPYSANPYQAFHEMLPSAPALMTEGYAPGHMSKQFIPDILTPPPNKVA